MAVLLIPLLLIIEYSKTTSAPMCHFEIFWKKYGRLAKAQKGKIKKTIICFNLVNLWNHNCSLLGFY
jgi:hypothetical protein